MPDELTTSSKPVPPLTRRQRDFVDEIVFGDALTGEEAARAAGYVGDPARAMRGDPALEAELSGALEIRSLVERAAAIKRLSAIRDDPATPVETVILVCKEIAALCTDNQPANPLADFARRATGVVDPMHRRHFPAPSMPGATVGDVPALFHGLPQAGEWNSALVDLGRRRIERAAHQRNDTFLLCIDVVEGLRGVDSLRVDLLTTGGGSGGVETWTVVRSAEFAGPKLLKPCQLWFENRNAPAGDNFAKVRIRTTGSPVEGVLKVSI